MAQHGRDRTEMAQSLEPPLALARDSGRSLKERKGSGRRGADSEDGGEIAALLGSIRRRWLPASILGVIVGGIAVSLVWFFVEPPFLATAEIHIHEIPDRILFQIEDTGGFNTYKQTQMRLVKSLYVLSAALRDPEIAQLSMVRERERPIEWLQEKLEVESPATEFVQISLEGDRPKELAAIVNAVTQAYQEEVVSDEDKRDQNRLQELRAVETRLEEDLREKRKALQLLAQKLSTTDSETLSARQQMATEYFGQLRREHAQIRFELMSLEAKIAAKKQKEDDPESVKLDPQVVRSRMEQLPQLQLHRERQLELEELLWVTKERVNSPQHSAVLDIQRKRETNQKEMDSLRAELQPLIEEELRRQMMDEQESALLEMEKQAEVLTTQANQIEKELGDQDVERREMGLSSYQLEVQKQHIAETEAMAEQIKERIRQIEVELDAKPRVDVFQKAEVPHTPMVARKFKLMGLAGLGGFGFVAGLFVLTDLLSKRVSSITEVVQGLNLPIIGALPIMPRGLIDGRNRKKGQRPDVYLGMWKESIDSTRTLLLRHTATPGPRIIMVTSAISGEGKTTLACHLAISLAESGRKTLLIDADLRRPAIHHVFGISNSPGLSEVLRHQDGMAEMIQTTPIPGLSILPAGEVDPTALKILAADAAGPLLKELQSQFDFVIIDTAPVMPVTDALMIGPHADGAVFAVRRDVSRRGKIASACKRLEMVGVPLLGAVVIGLDDQTPTDRCYTPGVSRKPAPAGVKPEIETVPI